MSSRIPKTQDSGEDDTTSPTLSDVRFENAYSDRDEAAVTTLPAILLLTESKYPGKIKTILEQSFLGHSCFSTAVFY